MESALIITSTEKGFTYISELLSAHLQLDILQVHSCGEGRRSLAERSFDFVIISSPLPDETGENLARQIAASGASQVILAVNNNKYDAVSFVCENDGVLTVAKPINRDIFRQTLSIAKTIRTRLAKVQDENENLKQKIENIRIIDRAKNILIASCRMSEHEAHRYIEKMAMDKRSSKRVVSEKIIHDYKYGPDS